MSPGNAGIGQEHGVTIAEVVPKPEDAVAQGIDLVIVGPEEPLVHGIADRYRTAGIPVVGPDADLARLEGSKSHAKDFMVTNEIPTAEYRTCRTIEEARQAVAEFGAPVVIKADGLAAGKGVSVCPSVREADAAIESIMRDKLFGDAGNLVVVERMLRGFEASIIVLVDESGYLVLPTAQDHKPIGEGNTGPNTGGMGVVAPNPEIDSARLEQLETTVVGPSVRAIQRSNRLFRGILFIGVMIDEEGPKTLEYNVRFGDPETQAILPLLEGDFGVLMRGLAEGRLSTAIEESGFRVGDGASCAVIAASEGYPGPYTKGIPIRIEPQEMPAPILQSGHLFFAGVTSGENEATRLLTAGGRVVASTAWAPTLQEARRRAYAGLQMIHFQGMQYRTDIGGPAVLSQILEEERLILPQFEKRGGILPVVVQDSETDAVLMVAYTNREAFIETRRSGYASFWSTSRNELWTKGTTSGDYLAIEEIRIDCDQDALLYRVRLLGTGVCHTHNELGEHRRRCFYRRIDSQGLLEFDE